MTKDESRKTKDDHFARHLRFGFLAPRLGRRSSFVLRRSSFVLAVLALLLAACDSGPQPTPNFTGVVKVGVAAPYTGDTADGGIQIWQGAQLAADEANAQGGILGKKIEIVPADDAANPGKAQEIASGLVAQGVVAVVGHKDSGVSIPASVVYNAAGIVQITPTSSNPTLTEQGFDTVFRVCPVDKTQGPVLAEFMIETQGLTQIAVIYANTAYGLGLRDEFERRAGELGVTPLASEQITRGDKDFAATLQRIQPFSPQAIFYAGSLPEAIIIVQQMKEFGIKATFVGGDALFQPEFIVSTGSAAEGAYISSFFPDMLKAGGQAEKNWVAQYRETFKRNPGGNSSGGYVAALAIFQAMKNANSTDPAQVKTALKSLDMDSFIGRIAFDQKGDLQDQREHLRLFHVKEGAFVPVP
jgi:branched-chain amino acid transport system substrate-binding protein